jgi:hypothetical protein
MAATVLIAGACAVTPDYVLVNRSDVAIAIAPNVQIAPCSAANFTESELKAAGEAFLERAMEGDFSWVPADAVALTGGIPGPRIGAPRPMIFVISGSNLPQVFYGPLEESDLPACGGEPQM